jgi:hypothetical protein
MRKNIFTTQDFRKEKSIIKQQTIKNSESLGARGHGEVEGAGMTTSAGSCRFTELLSRRKALVNSI